MSLSIIQHPGFITLSQSPIVFTVSESNSEILNNNTFQYLAKIYYWKGEVANKQLLPNYELSKYKNTFGIGIFDFSKILNSLFSESLLNNVSNTFYYSIDFYSYYLSGSTWTETNLLSSDNYKLIEGFKLFNESIYSSIDHSYHFPLLTDGPITQYYNNTKPTYMSLYQGKMLDPLDDILSVRYSQYNGSTFVNLFIYNLPSFQSTNTENQICLIPTSPLCPDFPITGFVSGNSFVIEPIIEDDVDSRINSIKFDYKCNGKFENIILKWKNRFGGWDNFNFNMVSTKSFSNSNKTFQKQLGSWESSTFNISPSDSTTKIYSNSQSQTLTVNTDYVDESYNEIFKQLIVSDEIYWISDRDIPLLITTNNINLKTRGVDKLINYTFSFSYSQPYKLTI